MSSTGRFLAFCGKISLFLILFLAAGIASAQSRAAVNASARMTSQPDFSQKTMLAGNIPHWAVAANDLGRVPSGTRMTNMHLVLARAPQVDAAFQQFLADVQDPSSPRYHHFLSPQEMADQYGIAPTDLAAVKTWLNSVGLQVDDVAAGGVFIAFSGSAVAIENAFNTQLHHFQQDGKARIAVTTELSIPESLRGIIRLVSGVSEGYMSAHSHIVTATANHNDGTYHPNVSFTSNTVHALAPADFNAIYDITTPINSGTTGTGNRVAIIINSRVAAADITAFKTFFGVTATAPNTIVLPGFSDPGINTDSEGEADLDVQRVMGTAPGAGIDMLVFDGDLLDSSIEAALQYEIGTLNDSVVNMSFGSCDSGAQGLTRDQTFNTYASTAAGQGISIFVSSGDNAAAGCNANYTTIPATQVLSTNVICSSSYVTCVGGTEFNDPSSATYWSATNNATTKESALGYIPEGGWNEPSQTSGSTTKYVGLGTGGGITKLSKPSWQVGTGVPSDSFRHVPDISFAAAGHDGYLVCESDIGDNCTTGAFNYFILGTSASSPSMAGIQAIINQQAGSRQGAMGPALYAAYANNATTSAFHDVTVTSSGVSSCVATTPSMCNNSTPSASSLSGGLSGYLVTTGYDQVTGLGSLDVNKFLATVTPTPTFTVTPATLAMSLYSGAATGNTNTITVASVNSFAGTVTMSCLVSNGSGTAAGSCSLASSSLTLTAGSSPTDVLTIVTTPGTSGVLNVTVTGVNGSMTVTSSTIAVTLTASHFIMSSSPATTTANSGTSAASTITLTSQNGFAGTVAVSCAGSMVTNSATTATTCSASPATVTLTANGTTTTAVTIPTTSGVGGTLTATVSGSGVPTGGTIDATANTSVVVTVTAPGLTASAATSTLPTSGTLISGATSGNTDVITFHSTNGFVGIVTPACVVTGNVSPAPTCSFSPLAALTSGGTATTTLTVNSTPGTSGVASIAVTGSGTSTGLSVVASSNTAAIAVSLTASSFTLTPSPSTLSFTSGAATGNTSTITLATGNGFNGSVALSCSVSTSAAYYQPHCAVAPTPAMVSTGTSPTPTLTITSTAATTAELSKPWTFGSGAVLAMLFCIPAFRRRRTLRSLAALGVLFCGIAGLNGCGGSSTPAPPTVRSSAGTYTVTVTGTGTTSGASTAATASTTVSVVIN